MKVQIFKVIRRTAGHYHSWCETNCGILRKPNNKLPVEEVKPFEEQREIRLGWWKRVLLFIRNWIKKIFTS